MTSSNRENTRHSDSQSNINEQQHEVVEDPAVDNHTQCYQQVQ